MSDCRLNGIRMPRSFLMTIIVLLLARQSTPLLNISKSRVRLSRSAILSRASFTSRNRVCILKLADDYQNNKSEKLGGTTSTRNLFALTEIFGKITSLFQDNSDDENTNLTDVVQDIGSSAAVTTQKTTEDIEKIAAQIKKEYEAIFWAVSSTSVDSIRACAFMT
jgi:hypothetical protein